MAQLFTHVNRGDLITAQSFNEILDKMYEMETRLEFLESGSDPGSLVTISGLSPITEQNIGRTLEISGSNFEIPPEKNKVTVDGVPVVLFGLSTVQLLRIVIPSITGAPKNNAQIVISNVNGSVSRLYKVLEEIPVVGDPPEITSITDDAGGAVLKEGGSFIINGLHLGPSPVLRLRSREPGHLNDAYNITAISSVSDNQIQATLPSEIELVENQLPFVGTIIPDDMEIELTVGAFDPVLEAVQVEA